MSVAVADHAPLACSSDGGLNVRLIDSESSTGIQFAVLAGDPSKAGAYTIRLKMPSGSKVNPHWHTAEVDVTVITGTLGFGMGDKFDKSKGQLVKPGGFIVEAKEMHHYVWADGPTVLQAHGEGPLVITYVNPAEDPSTAQH